MTSSHEAKQSALAIGNLPPHHVSLHLPMQVLWQLFYLEAHGVNLGVLINQAQPHCPFLPSFKLQLLLFTYAFACLVCMHIFSLHKGCGSICTPTPVFKLASILATKGGWEEAVRKQGGKKEGTVFLTHTALSFCSVTVPRSAEPPFSQSWSRAKKAVSYHLYFHNCCFNSTHLSVTVMNINHKTSALHAGNARSLQL